MNLKNISDQMLLEKTESLVRQERELLTQVLHHLREIESRRLFSSLGFRSLFDYAVKRLKYSEDQAARRISAMRLLKELPEIEQKIESGALTLTNLGMAQTLFRHEQKKSVRPEKIKTVDKNEESHCVGHLSRSDKLSLLEQLEHKSKRQAEQIVLSQSSDPQMLKPDRIKTVTETKIEIQFVADQTLLNKIEKLKGLLAHSHPQISMAELMTKLCDLGLQQLDPVMKKAKKAKSAQADAVNPPAPARVRDVPKRSHISSTVRQEIWFKAKGQCQNCGSQHALQIDHIKPVALGGLNEADNLRLLCRPCNQRAAIEMLGQRKMERFWS